MAGEKRKRSADDMGDNSGRAQAPPAQQEEPSVLQQFGHLYEGLEITINTPAGPHNAALARFLSRRQLAFFGRWPEGLGVERDTAAGRRAFVLLTPPEYVAVFDPLSGDWVRVLRDEAVHGPSPYSREFWREYLEANGLPLWFLLAGHLSMLQETTEAILLSTGEALEVPSPRRGAGHLDLAAGLQDMLPTPDPEGCTLRLENLSREQRQILASRFPALAITYVDHVVVVLPFGHVVLRSATSLADSLAGSADIIVDAQATPWHPASASQTSSFFRLPSTTNTSVPAHANTIRPTDGSRERALERARHLGALVNPDTEVHGLGHWEWLQEYDEHLARAHGIAHQRDTIGMREIGALGVGEGVNADPIAVWYSDEEWVNPATQPRIPGRWDFQTDEARDEAALQFGGNEDLSLPARPSARDIWNLRRRLLSSGSQDITAGINVVWIPAVEGDNVSPVPSLSPSARGSLDGDGAPEVATGDLSTSSATDQFDRTNGTGVGGENDQTGTAGKANHYAIELKDGRKIVIDQSVPEVGRPERHMLRTFTKAGTWLSYRHAKGFDWNDAKSVKKLKAWREQHSRRGHFGKKRDDTRVDYTHEQRQWVGEVYKRAKAKDPNAIRPEGGLRTFTDVFNRKWGANEKGLLREYTGITTMWDRVRREIDEHGEVLEKKGRGWTMKEKSAALVERRAKGNTGVKGSRYALVTTKGKERVEEPVEESDGESEPEPEHELDDNDDDE